MNINELYEEIQDNLFPEELNGEFLLHRNVIIWSYNATNTNNENYYYEDDEEDNYNNFNGMSIEEQLLDAYQEDYDKLEEFLDDINEFDNWTISDNEINGNVITFKIS